MRNWQSGHKAGHKMARKGSKRERLEAACAGQACSDARLTTARFDPNGDKFYGDTDLYVDSDTKACSSHRHTSYDKLARKRGAKHQDKERRRNMSRKEAACFEGLGEEMFGSHIPRPDTLEMNVLITTEVTPEVEAEPDTGLFSAELNAEGDHSPEAEPVDELTPGASTANAFPSDIDISLPDTALANDQTSNTSDPALDMTLVEAGAQIKAESLLCSSSAIEGGQGWRTGLGRFVRRHPCLLGGVAAGVGMAACALLASSSSQRR